MPRATLKTTAKDLKLTASFLARRIPVFLQISAESARRGKIFVAREGFNAVFYES